MRIILILSLLLPLGLRSADLYQIHQLSEGEIQRTYIRLLEDAYHYADRDWTNSSSNPAQGHWSAGFSGENKGIRELGSMVLGCGTLLKYDDGLSASERADILSKASAAIRYATATHFTGSQKCTDGRKWGGLDRPGVKTGRVQWQSSYWAGSLALGAWLMWDKLDPQLQKDVERVVAAQDNLLATGNPPVNLWGDTKAEENGWSVPLLSLGELMFPTNSNAASWHDTAVKYMMNTLCTEADTHDTNLVDGRAVKDWVLGVNIQPDYTLENHNIFHPSYVACSTYFLTQAQLIYALAGRPIPGAASHHVMDSWGMFRTVVLPWSETAYPQGMDWELHGLPYIDLYGTLGTRGKDPFAARMEQQSLQYLRNWQVMCQGSLTLPGSPAGFNRHAINVELTSYGFLAHKIFGPSVKPLTSREANAREEGVWEYPFVQFIEHRTAQKLALFSWKNRIMGQVIPIENHEDNPEFTVPISDGFVGSFDISPRGDARTTVVEHSWEKKPDGFETTGTVLLNGGRLKQTLRMISVGSQAVVYEDRVTALTNLTVRDERGVPIGIENDSLTGGTRLVSDQDGRIKFDWEKTQKTIALPGSWANVSGRLGVVMADGSGMAYAQASGYSHGSSIYTDILYGSCSNQSRDFKTGEEVAHRIGVFFLEVTPKETASLAKSCRIETTPNGQVLLFKQPDGKAAEVPVL